MSIAILRNKLNKEIKRFGKFSKTIAQDMNSRNIPVDVIFEQKKSICLSKIKKYDTIVIITHGNDDVLYHKYDFKLGHHQDLINSKLINNSVELQNTFKNKKIIAISCRTARVLGPAMCHNGCCKAYLGFYNQIHFDKYNNRNNGYRISKEYCDLVNSCYKEVFTSVIEQAIVNRWSFNKLKNVLEIELKQKIINKSISFDCVKSSYYRKDIVGQAIIAVTDVANNIMVFGDSTEIVS